MAIQSVKSFVTACKQSSNDSYQQFKELLILLEDNKTRAKAYDFLLDLKEYCLNHSCQDDNFQFLQQTILDENDESISLDLLQFPSTFLPESWSFTFYEGLIRYPFSEYNNKKVIELGCGIGWISIALALRYAPDCVCGLDINPKAITCARLNVFLNAFDESGALIKLSNGQTLLDAVSFHESNLFSCFDKQEMQVDKIIGCIPQVLNPEPQVMETLITETATDEYLHSLSNYFAKQGFIEDQFGLGLIASAVEQSIALLESDGKLILNLGGRPGRSVLERLMQRRGFKVRRVWQTQVEQDADTEIDTLVDIEKKTGHRFEFYMSANSDTPIDARTAKHFSISGGRIYHSVDVYEAQMLYPEQVKTIYQSINEVSGTSLRSAIDLTYDNYLDAEERYSFLAFLAKHIFTTTHFPYEDTAGLYYFRQQLAEYFRYYYHIFVNEQQITISPSRKELLHSLLTNYCPQLTLVSKSLQSLISSDFDNDSTQILQVPSQVELLMQLVSTLKPQLIITQLDQHEIQSSQLVEQLIDCAQQSNALLVLDITASIELSSQPKIQGIYRYLSNNPLPDNLIIMAGLVNNRVYKNYSLNITLSSNTDITKYLIDAAELTYSRTPILKQYYYAHLLEQLLYFQRSRRTESHDSNQQNQHSNLSDFHIKTCKKVRESFQHPAIAGNNLPFNGDTIRLDYGENELPTPDVLKHALFESYLVRKCSVDDSSASEPIMQVLSKRFNFPLNIHSKIVYGNGVAPLFSALLTLCLRKQKTLLIPAGSYGYFVAAAQYKGIKTEIIKTYESNNFKVSPEALKSSLQQNPSAFLFLNAPVVNPTGAIYTQSELNDLLTIASEYETTLIIDTIFTGLEYQNQLSWDINDVIINPTSKSRIVLLGGISKEFAAGGLRFGYACSTSLQFMRELDSEISQVPHITLGYAVKKVLESLLNKDVNLMAHLDKQRTILAQRADILSVLLARKGWHVIKPSAGLFLIAKPESFIHDNQLNDTQGADLMVKKLFKKENLVINNSTWTGIPGYCRFVLSCCEDDFTMALLRLERF